MAAAYLLAPDLEVRQRCRKFPHETRLEAVKVKERMKDKGGLVGHGVGELNAYRCLICGAWHVGHR